MSETTTTTPPGTGPLSDAARALAVLDRLLAQWPDGVLTVGWQPSDHSRLHATFAQTGRFSDDALAGSGPTPAAALLALGARLEEGEK